MRKTIQTLIIYSKKSNIYTVYIDIVYIDGRYMYWLMKKHILPTNDVMASNNTIIVKVKVFYMFFIAQGFSEQWNSCDNAGDSTQKSRQIIGREIAKAFGAENFVVKSLGTFGRSTIGATFIAKYEYLPIWPDPTSIPQL